MKKMFKIGKVINYYEKIGITIVKLSAPLSVGDKIKFYKDGELILYQQIERIIMNQKNIPFANSKDVVALVLDEKVQKGSEVYKTSQLGTSS
ncbi:MAG: hypothetical protein AAB559_01855 [Patescibacteria group bacterium]|mgnify:FL=1